MKILEFHLLQNLLKSDLRISKMSNRRLENVLRNKKMYSLTLMKHSFKWISRGTHTIMDIMILPFQNFDQEQQ